MFNSNMILGIFTSEQFILDLCTDSFCDALAEIRDGLEATGCTFVGALDAAEYDGCASRICRDGKVIGLAVDDGASEAVSDARMEKWIAAVGF